LALYLTFSRKVVKIPFLISSIFSCNMLPASCGVNWRGLIQVTTKSMKCWYRLCHRTFPKTCLLLSNRFISDMMFHEWEMWSRHFEAKYYPLFQFLKCPTRHFDPWTWGHYIALKIWHPNTNWRTAISKKNGSLNQASAKTSKLASILLFTGGGKRPNTDTWYTSVQVTVVSLWQIMSLDSHDVHKQPPRLVIRTPPVVFLPLWNIWRRHLHSQVISITAFLTESFDALLQKNCLFRRAKRKLIDNIQTILIN